MWLTGQEDTGSPDTGGHQMSHTLREYATHIKCRVVKAVISMQHKY